MNRVFSCIIYCAIVCSGLDVDLRAGEGGPRGQTVPAVSVEIVGAIDRSQAKTFVGTVSGAESVAIVARVSGALWKASFREGGLVRQGDVLYEIEDTVYKANVRIAEALIKQCEADYDLADKEHERSEGLLASKAISTQSYDMTLSTRELKWAKLEEAKANLILARHDYDNCRIVSPISGRIGEKLYSEGNYITPSLGTLATVVQYQPIKVQFSMSESDFFRYFRSHDELKDVGIAIVRANGERYTGSIATDFVDNTVDRRTDTITVHLECDNPGDQLLPGGYVQVQVAERYEKPVPAVSTSAIMTDGRTHYVYVVGPDDTIERRDVEIGDLVNRVQGIVAGLRPGERVVTGGLNKVQPGAKVRPVAAQS